MLRVAIYCRMGRDNETKSRSQIERKYYLNKIDENPNWELEKIFMDEESTTEFTKLIQMCKSGDIDLIIAKSTTRFRRNIYECLYYMQQLEEMGIPIMFEKEGITTMTPESKEYFGIVTIINNKKGDPYVCRKNSNTHPCKR